MPTALKKKSPPKSPKPSGKGEIKSFKIRRNLEIAKESGLLSGARSVVLRGRMPSELVAEARRKSGITSDSKLLEAALASLALTDDYGQFLYEHRGTVDPDLDLEF
jgi:hypothetical protein